MGYFWFSRDRNIIFLHQNVYPCNLKQKNFIIYLIELGKPNDISRKFELQLFFTPISITMKSQKWKVTPLHILFYYSQSIFYGM